MSIGFRHMLDLIEEEINGNDYYASAYDIKEFNGLCKQVYLAASATDSVGLAQQNDIKNRIDLKYDMVVKRTN